MLIRHWAERWQGVLLTLVAVVATLWLGITGQLGLYIHPRYFVFTSVMATIGLVLVIAGFALREKFETPLASRWQTGFTATGVVLLSLIMVATIVVPPRTLTAATATQRDVNSGGLANSGDSEAAAALVGTGDFDQLSVKEWASLLAQSSDPVFYADKTAKVLGFVSPDAADPENVFYVARFVITCCAVDAQPIGVAVYLPGWQDDYDVDDWVEVAGVFEVNPSSSGSDPLAIRPTEINPVEQPGDPYVY